MALVIEDTFKRFVVSCQTDKNSCYMILNAYNGQKMPFFKWVN